MTYFYGDNLPLKKDLKRHSDEEKELLSKIREIEENPDEFSELRLKVYRHLLNQLLQSKAELVDKIGRRK